MAQERLEPRGRPKKHQLDPVKGSDGIWRLDRVRHRTFGGRYVRTSGSGYTKKECLADWEDAFERNRRKGSVRESSRRRHQFALTDPMSVAFGKFIEDSEKRVAAGRLTQQTRDIYWRSIYKIDSPRANPDSIKLNAEMGDLAIAEAGKPSFLSDYLEDVADVFPGVACRHYVVLSGTFNMLTLAGLFDVSPMAPVPRPDRGSSSPRALHSQERDQLYAQICERNTGAKYFRMLYLTILGTGIRPGEAFALWWADIPDLDDQAVEKAVVRVGATAVKPMSGGPAFRQNRRKKARAGACYYIMLPAWLTTELREFKRICAPGSNETPIFLSRLNRMVEPMGADLNLARAKADSAVDWITWGNLRDTVATHVAGRTGDSRRASAQLGHADGASVASTHYIDQAGYVRVVVDNSEVLEELKPTKVGVKLESGVCVNHSD